MKRLYVGLVTMALAAGTATAQTPPAAAAAPASRGTAVFNVVRVMKDYQKWQYFAAQMNKERTARAGELAAIRNQVMDLEAKLKTDQIEANKRGIEQQMVAG